MSLSCTSTNRNIVTECLVSDYIPDTIAAMITCYNVNYIFPCQLGLQYLEFRQRNGLSHVPSFRMGGYIIFIGLLNLWRVFNILQKLFIGVLILIILNYMCTATAIFNVIHKYTTLKLLYDTYT